MSETATLPAGLCNTELGGGQVCLGNLTAIPDGEFLLVGCDRCNYEAAVHARKVDVGLRRKLQLERADLPESFVGKKFEETPGNADALKALREWLASYRGEPGSLLPAPALWGLQGRGKSHLLVALCSRLINECDLAVLFCSTRSLLRGLQRFEDESERERLWQRATAIDVLALDDLGAQQITDWRHDQLGELIDERYSHERPVLIATNFPPSQWDQVVDARTASRLRGMTFAVELRGTDRRQTQIGGDVDG